MSEARFIIQLNRVDLLTLSGLITSGLALVSALDGMYLLATALLFLAMLGDALDGIWARKRKIERAFGRYLDGFMDMQIYLLSPALVLYLQGFDGVWLVPLLALIGCGCIRLSVFNDIGNIQESDGLAYLGMPVFWSVFILGAYQLLALCPLPLSWLHSLLALVLLVFSYAMLLRKPFFKFKRLSHIFGLTLGGFALMLLLQWLTGSAHV